MTGKTAATTSRRTSADARARSGIGRRRRGEHTVQLGDVVRHVEGAQQREVAGGGAEEVLLFIVGCGHLLAASLPRLLVLNPQDSLPPALDAPLLLGTLVRFDMAAAGCMRLSVFILSSASRMRTGDGVMLRTRRVVSS